MPLGGLSPYAPTMRVSVLGETTVERDRQPLELTSMKLRQIVATLAMASGRPVTYDALVDMMWGDEPPEALPGTLHAYIAALRRTLEPDRAPRAPARMLVTVGAGYALRIDDDALDATRFQRAVSDTNRRLGRSGLLTRPALRAEELAAIVTELDEALALWRGEAYADLGDADVVRAERARLDELRTVALEDRATVRLAQGAHAPVAAELEALTGTYPMRERLWALRALALVHGGRQADALDVLRELADLLDDELGLEPSEELRDLQVRILRQDPALRWEAGNDSSPTGPPSATTSASGSASHRPSLPAWPMVGRVGELARLGNALEGAVAGAPTYATLTGEPGIGKSRLAAELGARAVDAGARLLVGRCSQDDGAPPLWPWQQVLRGLDRELEVEHSVDHGAGFRTWDTIVQRVRDAARNETIVVVLDDLHWADRASLQVLRLLVETLTTGRLLVLATWRPHPEPTGALADVAEAMSRAHAVRVELTGLDGAAAGDVVAAISSTEPSSEDAEELARRTDGNPFYLVEFARLAQEGDLAVLLTETAAPVAVRDVVSRRIGRLSDADAATLRAASVVGRSFDLDSLVAATGDSEDDLIDGVERAVSVGLVREDGVGRWSFGHALVRDAAYEALGPTRAARAHARVAAALEGRPGRETEVARHWLAAGVEHAGHAWRAAVRAAAVARLLHAHEEAALLLRQALEVMAEDPTLDDHDRLGVLIELADAERWSGQWPRLREAAELALDVAETVGDPEALAKAATIMTIGAFWQTSGYGEVHHRQIAALRRVLTELPTGDSSQRCRVMTALASELYFLAGHEERAALVEESLAMARRLVDDALLVDACLTGFISLWRPDTAAERLALAAEASELSQRLGDGPRFVVAATLRAVALSELGRVEEMWQVEAGARSEAERLRIPYGLIVLDGLVVPWLAMAGRENDAREAMARMQHTSQRVVLFQLKEALLGAALSMEMWSGDVGALLPALLSTHETTSLPVTSLLCQMMIRDGDPERARDFVTAHPIDLPGAMDWFSMLLIAAAAETALWVDDPDLGESTYAQLAPYVGTVVASGSSVAEGPVDAFLAMAACAAGEREAASRHADGAVALMEQWGIPRCAAWFDGVRERFGF